MFVTFQRKIKNIYLYISFVYHNTDCFQYSIFSSYFISERLKVFKTAYLAFSTAFDAPLGLKVLDEGEKLF